MNKIIIIITVFVFSVSLAQNTTILFLRDGSIIQYLHARSLAILQWLLNSTHYGKKGIEKHIQTK